MAGFIPTDEHFKPPSEVKRVDFDDIDKSLAENIEGYLIDWFSDKKIEQEGSWWRIGNKGSLSVNIYEGHWSTFEGKEKGQGLLSLYAWRHNIDIKEAAADLSSESNLVPLRSTKQQAPKVGEAPQWEHCSIPPASIPDTHWEYGKADHVYKYLARDGSPIGVVLRWDAKEDRDKIIRPVSWLKFYNKDAPEWKWKHFAEPRPLFRGEHIAREPSKPILIVEGESTTIAAQEMLKDFVVVSWPQGCSGVSKADWSGLNGRDVTIWPDNDEAGIKAAESIKKHLPQAKIVKIPSGKPKKWDLADAIAEGMTREGILDEINKSETSALLNQLKHATISSESRIAEMNKKRVESVEVIEGMALMGEATVFYMQANGGKTLITFSALIDSIRKGRIDGSKVYYILADDTFNGSIEKGQLAKEEGFNLVVPDSNEGALEINDISPLMEELARSGQASGIVFIVDTLKKIVSMMQKAAAADFGKVCRSFVQSGGTFIALGHVNKHRGDDGKAVHEGTGDIVNDFDCAFVGTIDTAKDDPNRQVTFENTKLRGPVQNKVSLSYNADAKTPWMEKLKSVSFKSPEEAAKVKKLNEYYAQLNKDLEIVCWIYDFLANRRELTTAIKQGGCPHAGQKKVDSILKRYGNMHPAPDFRFWTLSVGDNNAKIYSRTINNPKAISEAWRLGAD
jgi:hypothetical protein